MRLSGLRQIVAAAVGSQRVPHLSLTGNTFTLVSDAENKKVVTRIDDEGVMYVDVHFVDANTALSKIFYKEKFSTKEEDQVAPTCYSDDGVAPSIQASEPQCDSCAQCPHNVWGTAVTDMGNKGKACRDMWKTAVVVPEFSKEALFQLRVPPASLKAWNAYVASFAEFKFPDGTEWTIGHVITRVYFEPGKQGIINFHAVRQANEQELTYLGHVQEENKATVLIGLAQGAPALPAPPKKEQKAIAQQTVASAVKKNLVPTVVEETVVEQEEPSEEDYQEAIEKAVREEMAARMAAKKAAQPAPTATVTKLPGAAKASGVGQPGVTKVAKAGLSSIAGSGVSKVAKAAGVPEMEGMRTVKKSPIQREDAVDAEVVEEQAPLKKPANMGKPSGVDGIPNAQLPADIQDMLAGIMGS